MFIAAQASKYGLRAQSLYYVSFRGISYSHTYNLYLYTIINSKLQACGRVCKNYK